MPARWHLLSTSLIALTAFYFTRNPLVSLVTIIIGIFIDCDHLGDYYLNNGKITFSITKLANELSQIDFSETPSYIPLHSIEFILTGTLATLIFPILPYTSLLDPHSHGRFHA